MKARITRIGFGLGAAVIAVGIAAGALAANQNTNGNQPPFRGGRMGPMGPMGPGPGFGLLGPIQRLGLTDAQKDQVKGIAGAHAEEFKALGERAREARRALQEAIAADPINDATIRQKSAEVAAVDADLAVASAHARAEVLKVLTAEQREQLKTFAEERGARGGPGGRGGRGR
jgi:Spy/CpxP family protein refolding chaperone